jgi:hypothetical protein
LPAPFSQDTCIECHGQDPERPDFMAPHQERFGSTCLDCHDGVDRLSDFDHTAFFPLEGAHAELACEGCHKDKVFQGTPSECVRCHAEPEIHAGAFGLACQNCHSAQAWTPAQLQYHAFPLDHGGQGEIACQTCHLDAYVQYTCYGCHDHQPEAIRESHLRAGVTEAELPACTECHPAGLKTEP